MDETERGACLQRAVGGDADALHRLIVHYHGPLLGTIAGRMDAVLRRHVDPEDVLQEAYAAAFKAIEGRSFDGPGGFYKWLEKIALNQAKEVHRSLRRQKRDIARAETGPPRGVTSYPDLAQRLVSAGTTPSRHIARNEASAAVISSMARLTDDQRAVVRMRFLEGLPVAEIAAKMDKKPDAIHALCHRGLTNLRHFMGSITHYLTHL